MKKILPIFLMSFTLFGCSMGMIKSFVQTPELKGIQLKSFSAIDKQAVFDVAVYNPNAFLCLFPASRAISNLINSP